MSMVMSVCSLILRAVSLVISWLMMMFILLVGVRNIGLGLVGVLVVCWCSSSSSERDVLVMFRIWGVDAVVDRWLALLVLILFMSGLISCFSIWLLNWVWISAFRLLLVIWLVSLGSSGLMVAWVLVGLSEQLVVYLDYWWDYLVFGEVGL